ncbi:hypothetical protein [Chachezhania sediminis]|uniref:hypothetical protein n=1 Tax=Chachezhania sediminis TaxID=2599291 RepID=UPI00131C0074|nr:hypothetical protein [Chachezhania sediminis]
MATPEPVYVRVSDSKAVVGINRATIYRWSKAGYIKIEKWGGCAMFSMEEFRAAKDRIAAAKKAKAPA